MSIKFETFSRERQEVFDDPSGISKWMEHYFRIKASNGEILAQSEGYRDTRDRDAAIALIKGGSVGAEIKSVKG